MRKEKRKRIVVKQQPPQQQVKKSPLRERLLPVLVNNADKLNKAISDLKWNLNITLKNVKALDQKKDNHGLECMAGKGYLFYLLTDAECKHNGFPASEKEKVIPVEDSNVVIVKL